ncbi:MAG: diacylglycerol kinase family protein [Rhodospirillales bacterium]
MSTPVPPGPPPTAPATTGRPATAAIRLGLISNIRSQQNRRGTAAIDAAIADAPEVVHARLAGVDGLPQALQDFARDGVGLIVTNGGDGTVQAVLTELLSARPFSPLPPLAVLPRGMTNMTAADVGPRGGAVRSLRGLVDLARGGALAHRLIRRHVLKVEHAAGYPAQYGMFFGTAGIVRGIEVCRTRVHARGLESDWATGVTLAGMLLGWLVSGGRGETFRGETIAVSIDAAAAEPRRLFLLLATTLDRLILGSRPFWNQDGGPVRFTAIADPPRHLVRFARRILYGPPRRGLPGDTYQSQAAKRIALEMACPFTLDGQMFEPEHGRPVIVSAEDEVDFVRL